MFLGAKMGSVDLNGLNQAQIKVVHRGVQNHLVKILLEKWTVEPVRETGKPFTETPQGIRHLWAHEENSWELMQGHFKTAEEAFMKQIENEVDTFSYEHHNEKRIELYDLYLLWNMLNKIVMAFTSSYTIHQADTFESLVDRAWRHTYYEWQRNAKQKYPDPDPQATQARQDAEDREREEDYN